MQPFCQVSDHKIAFIILFTPLFDRFCEERVFYFDESRVWVGYEHDKKVNPNEEEQVKSNDANVRTHA